MTIPLRVAAAASMFALLASGCISVPGPGRNASEFQAGTGEDSANPFGLRFTPMSVAFTPDVPDEPPFSLRIAWSEDTLFMESDVPLEFPIRAALTWPDLMITRNGLGWTTFGLEDPRASTERRQAVALDIRALLASPGLEVRRSPTAEGDFLRGEGTVGDGSTDIPFSIELIARNGRIVRAAVAAEGARESPYEFTPGAELRYGLEVPQAARLAEEVERKDQLAAEAHRVLTELIDTYAQSHAGALPERVTPDELRLEMLATGREWPRNEYAGRSLAAAFASGDFKWTRCTMTSAYYTGYGWDDTVHYSSWGEACQPSR